jgi:hypothetical protein
MIILNAQRVVETRVRGSHAPPCADEQARDMLMKCTIQKKRQLHINNGLVIDQIIEKKQSHLMAEEIINSYSPHD